MEGGEVQVPSYFLCPISLQIMRDPVTLPTGITYDRDNIEQWLLYNSNKHIICPVTKQPLPDFDLTPNHTLRRLIQAWCSSNASLGFEPFPTPRPPLDKANIVALLDEARLTNSKLPALNKLKKIVYDGSFRSKRCVEAAPGAVGFLASIISNLPDGNQEAVMASESDEAVCILNSLQISNQGLLNLLDQDQDFLHSLTALMRRTSNYMSRAHAVLLIKSLLAVIPATSMTSLRQDFFQAIVDLLRDRVSYQTMNAALKVLYGVCPWGRNTTKAVRAGGVAVLVELLLEEEEKRPREMMMAVLNELCGCADGRAEVVGHAAGLAVVSKNMIRVSAMATERAVRMLYAIALHPGTPEVIEEMLQVGVVSKLCLLLQVECGGSTREMVKEILRMHFTVWRSSPCISPQIKALYLSS